MIDISKGRYWSRPWSLVDGCAPCSPGCENCWSRAMATRFHKWPEKVTPRPDRLNIPLKTRKPTVFAIWNDLFHEDVPDEFIVSAYMTIYSQTRHTFLILTKRPERMAEMTKRLYKNIFTNTPHAAEAENVWHGLTVCNQQEADEKIPLLLQTPAAHRWISIEPMLGEIDIHKYLLDSHYEGNHACRGVHAVILGGETGPHARPMRPDWVRSVRDQCAAAGVPFFFKQWGEYLHESQLFDSGIGLDWFNDHVTPRGFAKVPRAKAGRLLDGRTHDELPWRKEATK